MSPVRSRIQSLSDVITEGVIYFMVIFSPWAFGTTQDWSIWTLNIAGYLLGGLLAIKLIERWQRAEGGGQRAEGRGQRAEGGGQRSEIGDQRAGAVEGGEARKGSGNSPGEPGLRRVTDPRSGARRALRSCSRMTILQAILTVLILAYCLISALNARATYDVNSQQFVYHQCLNWLPHSYDSHSSWFAFWNYLALALSFWAIRDWLAGGREGETARERESGRAGGWAGGKVGNWESGKAGAGERGSEGAGERESGKAGKWAGGSAEARERGSEAAGEGGQRTEVSGQRSVGAGERESGKAGEQESRSGGGEEVRIAPSPALRAPSPSLRAEEREGVRGRFGSEGGESEGVGGRGGVRGARSAGGLPRRWQRLFWVLCLNGALLAGECVVQRIDGTSKLLWLVEPRINKDAASQFGPYAYRSNAAQYFNLLWPACLGFWWMLHRAQAASSSKRGQSGPRAYGVILPCVLLMAACAIASLSRGGALVSIAQMIGAAIILVSARQFRGPFWRVGLGVAGVFLLVLFLSGFLDWTTLYQRFVGLSQDTTSGRADIYRHALVMARDFSLWGSGPQTFSSLYQLYFSSVDQQWVAQVHNDWLETWITFGGVGSSLIMLTLLLVFARYFCPGGVVVPWPFTALLWLGLIGCLCFAIGDFPFQIASILFLFLVLCAMAASLGRR